jgi:hypothetical protein
MIQIVFLNKYSWYKTILQHHITQSANGEWSDDLSSFIKRLSFSLLEEICTNQG